MIKFSVQTTGFKRELNIPALGVLRTSYTLERLKIRWSGPIGATFPISITLFSNILKHILPKNNPSKADFDAEICHLKSKSFVDNVKCYIIAILYDIQCFSLKNFIPDGPAAISFLIAKIGVHQI